MELEPDLGDPDGSDGPGGSDPGPGRGAIPAVGFIGTGEIAAAVVDGLCDGAGVTDGVYVSPRGAATAAALARRHPQVHVCSDNQSVVDAARLVVLAVRPGSVDEALREVRMPPGSVLVSTVAGVDHARLARLLGRHVTIVRAIPLPAVRHRTGLTAVQPSDPDVTALFTHLGGTFEVADPRAFAALSAATATISTHLRYLACVAEWVARQGVPAADADRWVRSTFAGVGRGMADGTAGLAHLAAAHETPHGINEQLREAWFDARAQSTLHETLDAVLARLTLPSR